MDNAAHAELLDHEVYHTPLKVQPQFEFRETPANYREKYGGPALLPDQIKVWRVQDSPEGNVVIRSYGFADSPDTEALAVGFNHGREYGALAIGRQGSFLQWGYSDPPSQMTEAGQRLFVNCIHYIHRFDGQAPLVRYRAASRLYAVASASAIASVPGDQKQFFLDYFPEALWDRYRADPKGLAAYYEANLELVYWDKVFRVDEELQSLGIASNRKVETLERLFELRLDPTHREIAQRLLNRYTDGHTKFDFQNGRDRIYFSDVGGYKFQVVPQGYLARETTKK
jgi:hypothetical protein